MFNGHMDKHVTGLPEFIEKFEVIGDYDGNGRDDIILYPKA